MTSTITLWPIIKALVQAGIFLANTTQTPPDNWHTQWHTTNNTQQLFVSQYLAQFKDLPKFKPDELKAWTSKNYQELNNILAQEHFAIRLEPFPADSFGMVAILDVMLEWRSPGTTKTIHAQKTNTSYAGVQLERGFTTFISTKHAHPIARVETKSGDVAWFTIADKQRTDFDLLHYINTIKQNLEANHDYQVLMFPKIDLDQQPDISWLLRMSYAGYFIAQAKQQTKLKMNEFGAHVKSAAAIAMMKSMPPMQRKVLMIDQPFFFWIEKPEVAIPVFAGYLDIDVWKDPGSLAMDSDSKQDNNNKKVVEPSVRTEQQPEEPSWWVHIKSTIQNWWTNITSLL